MSSVVRVDVTLQVGLATQLVEVSAAAAAVETERAEVRSEVSSEQLGDLPVAPAGSMNNST